MLTHTQLEEALTVLGALLSDRGVAYDLVVIGGGAPVLLKLVDRQATEDLDVVARIIDGYWVGARPLPDALKNAVKDVAATLDMPDNWLNAGPAEIMEFGLPAGFAQRAVVRHYGGLTVRFAERRDQVALKLDAAADKWPDLGKHLKDLRHLAPSVDELADARTWCLARRDPLRLTDVDEVIFHLTFEADDDWV